MPLPLKAGYNFNYAHVHRPPCFEMTSAEAYTDFYGLSYMISGENIVYSPDGTFIQHEGDMDFALKNIYSRSSSISDKPRECILIKFTDYMISDLLEIMNVDSFDELIGKQSAIHLEKSTQEKVLRIMNEMEKEWNAYNKYSEIILKGLLHKLILIFLNERSKKGALKLPSSNKKQEPYKCNRVCEITLKRESLVTGYRRIYPCFGFLSVKSIYQPTAYALFYVNFKRKDIVCTKTACKH